MELRIHPLKLGTLASLDKSKFTYGCNFGQNIDLPCFSWFIEGASKKILVDTGACSAELAERYHHLKIVYEKDDNLTTRLNRIGLKEEDIDIVIFSHLHWDHVYNLDKLINAKFIVQKAEISYAVTPLPFHQHAYEVYTKGLTPNWFNVFDRMVTIAENWDNRIAPGTHLNLEDCFNTFSKIESTCDHVIPGHDLNVLKQDVYC